MKHSSLNIDIDDYGNLSVVPVRCGRSRGTAFFVGKNQLLTAAHVIGPHTNNSSCAIQVSIGDDWKDCTVSYQYTAADVVLLNCEVDNPNDKSLKLVSSDCPPGEDLLVLGFPEEIGNGIDYFGVKVRNSRHLRKDGKDDVSRGFNVVVIRTDMLEFASYSGFSGSPVLNSKGDVVGIATDQFYNSLGYTSIRILEEKMELSSLGIAVSKSDVDTTQFGITTAADYLEKKLDFAGNRYSRETHVDNPTTNDMLSAFCNIGIIEKKQEISDLCDKIYREAKGKLKEYIEKGEGEKENELKKFQTTRELTYSLLSELDEIQYYKPEYSNECALINPWRKDVEKAYELLQNFLEYEQLISSQFLYVTGLAGQGKTHTLCHFADINKQHCPFYLFFGTEFGREDPLETMSSLLGWQTNDLEGLNKYVADRNKYAIFIIDAINEGSGFEYWKTRIIGLRESIAKYDRIKLILSFRSMDQSDELLSLLKSGWNHLEIAGFENSRKAIELHFKYNDIYENVEEYVSLPEFRSPLYLKIYCEAYHMLPFDKRKNCPRDVIYLTYLHKRNVAVSKNVDVDPMEQVTGNYVLGLAKMSVEQFFCFDVPRDKALSLSNDMCPNHLWSHNLMHNLINENILKEYVLKNSHGFVGFEFDSIGDYLKMRHIREKSDELIVDYIKKTMGFFHSKGMNRIERSQFSNVLTFLFAEWKPSEAVWKGVLNDKSLNGCFMKSMSFRHDEDEYPKMLIPLISKIMDEESKYCSPDHLLDNFNIYKYGVLKIVHDRLKAMSMSERDEKWTIAVNELSDRYGIIARINNLCDVQGEYQKERALMVLWFCTTSFPSVHARLVMILRDVFARDLTLIVSLAKEFEEVDDPYIHQGLFEAAYAALALSRNIGKCKEVSDYLVSKYYSDKASAPTDIIVRNWTLKIIELSSILDNTYEGWERVKAFMPFDSVQNPFETLNRKEIRSEDYFGSSAGANAINTSLFTWDFYRYVLGANNNIHSPVFAKNDRPENKIGEMYSKGDVKIDDIADAIAKLIRDKYKYSVALGEYDKSVHHGRYDNVKERIGKKYQWIGYFEVLSYLCDHYRIVLDRWMPESRFAELPYPWLSGEIPHFDPTIEAEETLSLKSSKMFPPIQDDYKGIADSMQWLKDDKQMPSRHFAFTGINGSDEWAVLNSFDTQSVFSNNTECTASVWYNAVLVSDSDNEKFEEWCKEKNNYNQEFLSAGEYEYHWNDYPHSSNYKDRTHEPKCDWSAPCEVSHATIDQLQEDFTGCYASYEFLRNSHAPCVEMMEELNLHTAERGIIRDENGKIAAININPTSSRMSGLVMRRDLLNQFLKQRKMKLYYFISISKQVVISATMLGDVKDGRYASVLKYEEDTDVTEIVKIKKI